MWTSIRTALQFLAAALSIAHTALRESALAEVDPRAYAGWSGGPADLTMYVRSDPAPEFGERAA